MGYVTHVTFCSWMNPYIWSNALAFKKKDGKYS